MLLKYAFHNSCQETSQAALRVLANSMLLKTETRQMVVDQGYVEKACSALDTDSWDNEFLISRIIFLTTYGTSVDLRALIKDNALAEGINATLARHAELLSKKATTPTPPMEGMALTETLKLVFNITHYCKDQAAIFNPSIPHIIALLWRQDIPNSDPLDPPFGPLVNSLLNMDLNADESMPALFPKDAPAKVCSRLIDLLDKAMKAYSSTKLDSMVTALVSILAKAYEVAPEAARERMRRDLLPTSEDRKAVLGKGQTLPARLLQNSTNPMSPSFRVAISHLLFNMSDKDASKFVENVGYGFASGFLFQNNVPIPASAQRAFSTQDATGAEKAVNPITGQFLDKEQHPEETPMTEEEKEREAERLFVLFERFEPNFCFSPENHHSSNKLNRLKKTGIVDVQNPIEKAVQEGRFEELPDDYDDEK